MSFSETESNEGLPDKEFIEVMRKHLHSQRKTFDGSTLVQFILSNIHKFHVVGRSFMNCLTIPAFATLGR